MEILLAGVLLNSSLVQVYELFASSCVVLARQLLLDLDLAQLRAVLGGALGIWGHAEVVQVRPLGCVRVLRSMS